MDFSSFNKLDLEQDPDPDQLFHEMDPDPYQNETNTVNSYGLSFQKVSIENKDPESGFLRNYIRIRMKLNLIIMIGNKFRQGKIDIRL